MIIILGADFNGDETISYDGYNMNEIVSSPLTYVPNIIIIDIISLLSLCTRLRLFGCLVYKLPPIVANYVKHVSPILNWLGIFSFDSSNILTKFFQYSTSCMSLIETIINVPTDLANERIHGLCKKWWPFSPE